MGQRGMAPQCGNEQLPVLHQLTVQQRGEALAGVNYPLPAVIVRRRYLAVERTDMFDDRDAVGLRRQATWRWLEFAGGKRELAPLTIHRFLTDHQLRKNQTGNALRRHEKQIKAIQLVETGQLQAQLMALFLAMSRGERFI